MRLHAADDGFSLVELIIAMFFLAVLSLAVLPLLIGAANASVVNRDHVKATSFATEQVAALRAGFPLDSAGTCTSLRASVDAISPATGPSGSGMTATVAVPSCPSAMTDYPASLTVIVTVFNASGDQIAELPTRFRVAAP